MDSSSQNTLHFGNIRNFFCLLSPVYRHLLAGAQRCYLNTQRHSSPTTCFNCSSCRYIVLRLIRLDSSGHLYWQLSTIVNNSVLMLIGIFLPCCTFHFLSFFHLQALKRMPCTQDCLRHYFQVHNERGKDKGDLLVKF